MKYLLVYFKNENKITEEYNSMKEAFESFDFRSKQGVCVALYNMI